MEVGARRLLMLNAVGGIAVLASYAWGISAVNADALWGGVPEALRPVYTVNMLLAAAGYFLFTPYILFRLDAQTTRAAGGFGYGRFLLLYALVLLPSALWLPATALLLAQPGALLWVAVRFVLALVAVGSLGLLVTLIGLGAGAPRGRALAVAGLVPFCLQTAVLDALIWPALFTAPGL